MGNRRLRLREVARDWLGVLLSVALIALVYLLPPDTSLSLVQQAGVLRVCVPTRYPPLVTGNPDAPGIDVEIVHAVARRLGVRVQLNPSSAMGLDWNPRQWRLTRAQCQLIAGGVVDTETTRSFLDVSPSYLETGWALVARETPASFAGLTVGVYAGVPGLDRVALSRFLRGQGATVAVVSSAAELERGLLAGRFAAAVTEALTARQMAYDMGWTAVWLPEPMPRYGIALGLWRGDTTLKRAVVRALEDVERSGELADILRRYELAPIGEFCADCGAAI